MPNECCYRHRCCYMICKRLSNRFMIANIVTSVLFIGLISALIFSFLPYSDLKCDSILLFFFLPMWSSFEFMWIYTIPCLAKRFQPFETLLNRVDKKDRMKVGILIVQLYLMFKGVLVFCVIHIFLTVGDDEANCNLPSWTVLIMWIINFPLMMIIIPSLLIYFFVKKFCYCCCGYTYTTNQVVNI